MKNNVVEQYKIFYISSNLNIHIATIEGLLQNEYFNFFLILLSIIIFANIFKFILKKYMEKIIEKRKTDIDNILLEIFTKHLYIFVIIMGLYAASKSLSILVSYASWMD